MAVYCKYHAEHVNTLCEQNAEFLMLNLVVCVYVCACVLYTVYMYIHRVECVCYIHTNTHTTCICTHTHTHTHKLLYNLVSVNSFLVLTKYHGFYQGFQCVFFRPSVEFHCSSIDCRSAFIPHFSGFIMVYEFLNKSSYFIASCQCNNTS